MLHCSLASSEAWSGVAKRLTDQLTMTAVDFPGHGKSPDWDGTGDYHQICTRAAGAFLEPRMHLIGHSLGATVALRLAIENPGRIASLTLIEPVYFALAKGTAAYDQHQQQIAPFAAAFQRGDLAGAARLFTDMWGTGVAWQDLPESLRQSFVSRINLIPATEGALFDDNAGVGKPGRIEQIACPVLLIEGDQSPGIITAIGDVLKRRLPDVQRQRIAAAGHMAPITHPKQVAGIIERFIGL